MSRVDLAHAQQAFRKCLEDAERPAYYDEGYAEFVWIAALRFAATVAQAPCICKECAATINGPHGCRVHGDCPYHKIANELTKLAVVS